MKCYAGMCCAAHDAAGCVAYTEAEKNQGVRFWGGILMGIYDFRVVCGAPDLLLEKVRC